MRVGPGIVVLALAASLACRPSSRGDGAAGSAPVVSSSKLRSRDLLAKGGIYPVVVPLEWKMVNADGKEEDIPHIGGSPFHRITAQGALLAKESDRSDRELVIFTALDDDKPPITRAMLDRYADDVVKELVKSGIASRVTEKRLFERANKQAGKVVIDRDAADGRVAINYLLEDEKRELWQLAYLVRRDALDRWRPLLAEVERPPE